MNMCSHRHPEIVFDIKPCPLCEANAEIEKMESELDELRDMLREANYTIAQLEKERENV
jgi:hypothetical protein